MIQINQAKLLGANFIIFDDELSPAQINNYCKLAKKILVASFNDVHIDLSTELTENGSIKFFTWDDIEGKKTFWHSSAHLLAEAVESLYPGV